MSRFDIGQSYEYLGVLINPHELHQRYATSAHGIHHNEQTARFAQPDKGYAYGARDDFINDLGDDVHPVKHMLHTHDEITVPFLLEQRNHELQFSEREEAELRTTAILHDIGECTEPSLKDALGFVPAGDVKYGTYAEGHKDREELIRNYLYSQHFQDLPPQLLKRVDEIDGQRGDPKTAEAFSVIERLGYFMTAQQAADIVIKSEQLAADPYRILQLGRLAVVVSHGHYGFLRSKQSRYPFVRQKLDQLMKT